jgi:uncharacterized membrane protein YfcA
VILGPQDLVTIGALAAITFLIGLLIGFIGAGGAGVALALLTTVFELPVHTAIGTAIAAMLFVTISGAISHFREGNVDYRLGLVVGLAGAIGAVVGADISQAVSGQILGIAAGLALWCLAFLVWLRTRMSGEIAARRDLLWHGKLERSPRQWAAGVGLGATGGAAAAFFGVGMAPFLQLGFLTLHQLPLRQTVGTTMLTLVFISAAGGAAMALHGDVSLPHLIGLTIGLGIGAYIGARFTRRAPRELLRGTVVAIPFLAGAMLLFL